MVGRDPLTWGFVVKLVVGRDPLNVGLRFGLVWGRGGLFGGDDRGRSGHQPNTPKPLASLQRRPDRDAIKEVILAPKGRKLLL